MTVPAISIMMTGLPTLHDHPCFRPAAAQRADRVVHRHPSTIPFIRI
ncbi:hypothetical protein [Ralstonia pseudosolanacearum]|uniref:Uncharacterized protein n=1 Tax=Ralstonia nicotianae (strain ATCC BAA-1114 / GMI1000) TaxID=267608 RepID=Q8XQU3_RALN1|nr:hypothetical protein [Ralstonia pseudosolanacearum]AGH86566.1 miscellaneous; unknown [Ralstonia pseudosolanacearum FQY_4]ANH36123.1 hypothetical protein A3768_5340 [Ralstonia solanacearum]MCK4136386.1 hypothetical protein [Ralstonia pseudosolanacearum]MCK4151339.1 hypothetical protein [Ralstonia pseudosolanacearum]MCQ4678792.1 hypothetical protein [Ralstonia pseudosolanacearum]